MTDLGLFPRKPIYSHAKGYKHTRPVKKAVPLYQIRIHSGIIDRW